MSREGESRINILGTWVRVSSTKGHQKVVKRSPGPPQHPFPDFWVEFGYFMSFIEETPLSIQHPGFPSASLVNTRTLVPPKPFVTQGTWAGVISVLICCLDTVMWTLWGDSEVKKWWIVCDLHIEQSLRVSFQNSFWWVLIEPSLWCCCLFGQYGFKDSHSCFPTLWFHSRLHYSSPLIFRYAPFFPFTLPFYISSSKPLQPPT